MITVTCPNILNNSSCEKTHEVDIHIDLEEHVGIIHCSKCQEKLFYSEKLIKHLIENKLALMALHNG